MSWAGESVDETFEHLVARLPAAVREDAAFLPYRLGLVHRPDGAWSDFTQLPPVHALPAMLGDVVELDPTPYVRAHRAAGFYCVALDRVADGQVQPDEELGALQLGLRELWIASVSDLVGGEPPAAKLVARAEARLRAAIRAERTAFATWCLGPTSYARAVLDKTDWLLLASRLMLESEGADAARAALERGHALSILALQLLDDAMDVAEDRAVRGASIGDLMDFPPNAFVIAARVLTEHAREELASGGLTELAAWHGERVETLRALRLEPVSPLLDELGALALSDALVRSVPSSLSWRPRAAPSSSAG